ncbi:predicted protein [Thalassiosira pseudonana CCMP1335]|uniref:EF-hand domain-containing protein n=1 Tax=Thalassiosira pseudonana TaxID=35128 RepID=B5YNV3_THAPS|nr:predicted protein [Thalassiosira pseudonana CCMP1335]ACI64699.1 predicted protein [Thalassiosira pseudonana CCMP1335]
MKPSTQTSDDNTVSSTECPTSTMPAKKSPRGGFIKKRGNMRKAVSMSDLTAEERIKAAKFDLDGDGMLDEAEYAMLKYDKDGDGNLGLEEIHAIVQEHLGAQRNIGQMKKLIAFLVCFVGILALSNLGTSLASAILAKETTADKDMATMQLKGTGEIMGTQSSGESFTAQPLDGETRRARRAMVVESLLADPLGEHAHRHLAKKNGKGRGCTTANGGKDSKNCQGKVAFDTNVMTVKEVQALKKKCDGVRNVNIKRSFPGGSEVTDSLCRAGTTVFVKG